jgi:EmrB/QacA subfamily drug resistance transporter
MFARDSKYLVLTAMIFAVAMMFVDQTIVSIAIPFIDRGLSLSATGSQWVINGYLLALAALFALGGKLSDVFGHRRMVIVGIVGFAVSSALCGATPSGSGGEAWLIAFRFVQGGFAALMFPAALAIVVNAFEPGERGKALAIFFGITGGLTSVGPIAGSFLLPWTWRSIFWINVPVAIIALVLTLRSTAADDRRPTPIDVWGALLVCGGMGLAVLGLQQSSQWGWASIATWGCIAAGALLLLAFVLVELRVESPLIEVRIFADRGFSVDNVVLFLLCLCFVPLFFFASIYSQIVLGDDAAKAGLYILIFFAGFATASQVGGRILDRRGARPAVLVGTAVAALGFLLWADSLTDMKLGTQWYWIVLTGAGMGLTLTPASTDAINRAPRGSYGEVTGITQTVRYFASSLGLAVLGTILIDQNTSNIAASLGRDGVPASIAHGIAHQLGSNAGSNAGGVPAGSGLNAQQIFADIQHDFAQSSRTVFLVMAGVMALCFVAALGMQKGIPEQVARATELGRLTDAALASSQASSGVMELGDTQ